MGLLNTLNDALTRAFYEGMTAHLSPRGLALPLDIFGEGEIRYGLKLGFILPLIAPDNRFQLAQDAIYQMDRIVINRLPLWVGVGGYITIGKREFHEVADLVNDTIILETRLLADHPTGQNVFHYSNPVEVQGNYSAGTSVINIDTPDFVVRGDHIAISSRAENALSFKEYAVEDYFLVSIDGNDIRQYQVTLDRGIHRSLVSEELIQMRAFTAYRSKVLNLPITEGFFHPIDGPFLVDWMSAPFIRDTDLKEVRTLQKYNAGRVELGPPEQVEKNHLILDRSIKADQFLFWEKVRGDLNYDGDTQRLIAYLDNDGKFWLKHTAVPNITPPFTYASGSIVTCDPSLLFNNDWFLIDDSVNAVHFEYQANSSYVPTPSSPASGWILPASPTLINNNDWFSLNDGYGTEIFFEYIQDSSTFTPTPGYVTVDISSAVFPVDVSVPTETAINKVDALKITASRVGAQINLTNDIVSPRGNQPIVLSSNLQTIGWTWSDMAGGTNAVETINIQNDTTAVEVAISTSAAINRSDLTVDADFPGVFNSFKLTSRVEGIAGNIPITTNITEPTFVIQGMIGGSGGMRWNFSVYADQLVKLRLRLFPNDWLPDWTIPAATLTTVTAELQATDEPVERIDILFSGENSPGEIQMGDWNISTPQVSALSYEYVCQQTGDYTHASTGIMIKPLFPRLDDLQFRMGLTDKLNTGSLRL